MAEGTEPVKIFSVEASRATATGSSVVFPRGAARKVLPSAPGSNVADSGTIARRDSAETCCVAVTVSDAAAAPVVVVIAATTGIAACRMEGPPEAEAATTPSSVGWTKTVADPADTESASIV
jgi:hypothetical protein